MIKKILQAKKKKTKYLAGQTGKDCWFYSWLNYKVVFSSQEKPFKTKLSGSFEALPCFWVLWLCYVVKFGVGGRVKT